MKTKSPTTNLSELMFIQFEGNNIAEEKIETKMSLLPLFELLLVYSSKGKTNIRISQSHYTIKREALRPLSAFSDALYSNLYSNIKITGRCRFSDKHTDKNYYYRNLRFVIFYIFFISGKQIRFERQLELNYLFQSYQLNSYIKAMGLTYQLLFLFPAIN